MNEAEELAAAEALNQLRARRKAETARDRRAGATPHAAAAAERSSSPESPGAPPSYSETAAPAQERSGSPPAGSEPARAHLAPVLNSFPPSVDGSVPRTTRAAPPSSGRPWRSVLLTATSMMLTKDARRRLRQLLAVLRLASEHLNSRVSALQTAMDADATSDGVKPKISKQAIRHDIITTIKKCVAMISTLATNSLPAVARDSVRSTILRLPSRWASQMEAGLESKEEDGETESAILALATETLVSIRNITLIVSETLDRADNWVERLPRFKRGKRLRDEDAPVTEGLDPGTATGPATGSTTGLASSSSSLHTTQPTTRPSSPDAGEKMPSPKVSRIATADEEKLNQPSTPGDYPDRSVASQ